MDVIRLVCPECDAVHRVKNITLGKLYRCKKCKAGLITMQPAVLVCPACGATRPPAHIEVSRLVTCDECEESPVMQVRIAGVTLGSGVFADDDASATLDGPEAAPGDPASDAAPDLSPSAPDRAPGPSADEADDDAIVNVLPGGAPQPAKAASMALEPPSDPARAAEAPAARPARPDAMPADAIPARPGAFPAPPDAFPNPPAPAPAPLSPQADDDALPPPGDEAIGTRGRPVPTAALEAAPVTTVTTVTAVTTGGAAAGAAAAATTGAPMAAAAYWPGDGEMAQGLRDVTEEVRGMRRALANQRASVFSRPVFGWLCLGALTALYGWLLSAYSLREDADQRARDAMAALRRDIDALKQDKLALQKDKAALLRDKEALQRENANLGRDLRVYYDRLNAKTRELEMLNKAYKEQCGR